MTKNKILMIEELNRLEKQMFSDIIKVITNKKYRKISADKTMVIFGRVYSCWILQELKDEEKLNFKRKWN